MVILLHRGVDFRPRAIINSRYRPVIVHHMGRDKSDKPPSSHGAWGLTFSGQAIQIELDFSCEPSWRGAGHRPHLHLHHPAP